MPPKPTAKPKPKQIAPSKNDSTGLGALAEWVNSRRPGSYSSGQVAAARSSGSPPPAVGSSKEQEMARQMAREFAAQQAAANTARSNQIAVENNRAYNQIDSARNSADLAQRQSIQNTTNQGDLMRLQAALAEAARPKTKISQSSASMMVRPQPVVDAPMVNARSSGRAVVDAGSYGAAAAGAAPAARIVPEVDPNLTAQLASRERMQAADLAGNAARQAAQLAAQQAAQQASAKSSLDTQRQGMENEDELRRRAAARALAVFNSTPGGGANAVGTRGSFQQLGVM